MEPTIKPIGMNDINLTGGVLKDKQDLVRHVTIDAVYDRFDETGRFSALKQQWVEGDLQRPHIFWDSDIAKWIEGVAFFLQKERNSELEARVDALIDDMGSAQEEDGYLNSYFSVVEPEAKFTRRTDHELYNAGHLIEAGIAYANATGKEKLLDIVIRYADLIDRTFRIEHSAAFDTPGHEEIELALFKLYEHTSNERYKLLAEYFIDTRGTSDRDPTYSFADQEHMQSHLPVREQKTAEGHSVRALYLYSGMADMARMSGDAELADVCETLFRNITQKRMYITGGVGSTPRGESFTFDYDLPPYTAYNETCASIAMMLFCRRLWLLNTSSKYADYAEIAFYNTVLSGLSLTGDHFFYENPIALDPRRQAFNDSRPRGLKEPLPITQRVKVFDCSCCPPNLVRIMGALGDYIYSKSENIIYIQMYANSTATVSVGGLGVRLKQTTNYPYDGTVLFEISTAGQFGIALRIPFWSEGHEILLNGEVQQVRMTDGYAVIEREWQDGDRLQLALGMEATLIEANALALDYCGRVAVTRGPLVYCAEGVDNKDQPLRDIRISDRDFSISMEAVAGTELPVIRADAKIRRHFDELYRPYMAGEEDIQVKLIPYYAWANRGVSEMNTWFLYDGLINEER